MSAPAGFSGVDAPASAQSVDAVSSDRTIVIDVLCVAPLSVTVLAGTTDPGFENGVLQYDEAPADDQPAQLLRRNLLNFPQGICQLDANTLLIADRQNNRIRKFNLLSRELTTFAGNAETNLETQPDGAEPVPKDQANLFAPSSICNDPTAENNLFISTDDVQKVIRRLDAEDKLSIVAGQVNFKDPEPEDEEAVKQWVARCLEAESNGTEACFSDLSCLLPAKLTNSEDTLVYVSSMNSQTIRSYNPKTGEVRHVLGNGRRGPHTDGSLEDPFGMAVDSKGRLIISCLEGYTILRYDPSQPAEKQLDCLAGRSGTRWFRDGMGATDSLLGDAAGLTVDPFDTIYFCDYAHGAIRAISPEGYVYTLVCADPQYTDVAFNFAAPFGIHFDKFAYQRGQPCLYVIDFHRLIKIELDPASFPDPQNVLTTGRRRGLQVNPNQFSLEQEISMIQAAQEQQAARDAAAASSSSSSEQAGLVGGSRAPSVRSRMTKTSQRSARGFAMNVANPLSAPASSGRPAGGNKKKKAAGSAVQESFAKPSAAGPDGEEQQGGDDEEQEQEGEENQEEPQRNSMSSCSVM